MTGELADLWLGKQVFKAAEIVIESLG